MYAANEHACVRAENSLSGLDPLIASLKQKVVLLSHCIRSNPRHGMTF